MLTLKDYVQASVLTTVQMKTLQKAIERRQNILISGSPAFGKSAPQ